MVGDYFIKYFSMRLTWKEMMAILAIIIVAFTATHNWFFRTTPAESQTGSKSQYEESLMRFTYNHPFRLIQVELERRIAAGENCEPGGYIYELQSRLARAVGFYVTLDATTRENGCYVPEVLKMYLHEQAWPLCTTVVDSAIVERDIRIIRGLYKPCE